VNAEFFGAAKSSASKLRAEPMPEPTEQIEVLLMSLDDVYAAARRGEFVHPHHVAALFFAEPHLR